MGFWDRVREWIGGGPDKVPDVASFDNAKLNQLWKERGHLTDVAREAVRAERERRGLSKSDSAKKKKPREPDTRPSASDDLIHAKPGALALLQTMPGRFLLVMLPRWSLDPIELPTGFAFDALLVCNHERRGWLDATRVAEELGIETIWATAEGAIDRMPESASGEAKVLPDELVLGALRLSRVRGADGALHADWRGSPVALALGPTMSPALPRTPPGANVYLGSLPEPDREGLWSTVLIAAHAAATMSLVSGTPRDGIQIILLGDAVGTTLRRHTHFLPGFGITVVGIECPLAPSAIALLGAALTGAWDGVRDWPVLEVEEAMEHLVLERKLDEARALVDRALARSGTPELRRVDATLRALAGDRAAARAALERAEGDAFSFVVLSAIRSAEGDHAGAEEAARRAHATYPGEFETVAALVRALWLAGRADDARKLVDDAPGFSLTGTQASDLYALIDQPVPDPAPLGIAHLASRAVATARRAPDRDRALRAVRRALELDPTCAPAREIVEELERA